MSHEEIEKCCAKRKLDVDSALHMVIAALVDGESKMLATRLKVDSPENPGDAQVGA